jgi:hypothetical protein
MKSPYLLGVIFLVGLLAAKTAVAETPSATDDQDYRKSMELYRANEEAYRANEEAYHNQLVANERTRQAFAVAGGAIVAGLIIFILIPAWRAQKALTAIARENQKILEEVRALLEKKAIELNKSATPTSAATPATAQPKAPVSPSLLFLRPR